jgi:hypothetical protein
MTPEERELLKRTLSVAEENNELLRKIQRSMRLARFMTLLYWLFIVGAFAGAYYVVKPYIESAMTIYQGARQSPSNLNEIIDFINKN